MRNRNLLLAGAVLASLVTGAGAIVSDTTPTFAIDPAGEVYLQERTMSEQVDLLNAAVAEIPVQMVSAPQVFQDIDDVLGVEVASLGADIEVIDSILDQEFATISQDFGYHITDDIELTRDFLAALPPAQGGEQFQCLAQALYFEARGESLQGQRAVAEVILNRVASRHYPSTICDVVHQGTGRKHQCQFSYTCDGLSDRIREPRAYENVAKVARLAIDGLAEKPITGGAIFYHTTAVNPSWARHQTRTAQIGVHLFYR